MSRRERLVAEAGPLDVDDGNTYGRIAKAYQASLNTFKATLVSKGLSPTEANAYKSQAIKNGSISSVAGAAQDSVDNAKTNQRMENKMAKLDAVDEAKWMASQAVIAQREQEKDKASELAGLQAYYDGRKAGEGAANTVSSPNEASSWWKKIGDWFAPKVDNTVTIGQVALTAKKLKNVIFTPLDSGMVSVSSNRPPGMRADYLDDVIKSGYDFPAGGNYAPGTIASRTATGLIDDAIKGSSWIIGGVVSTAVNLYDFGKDHTSSWGDFSDATIEKQEFWVSTIVDTALTIAIGVVAALAVGATLVALGATAPLWGTALLVGGVAIAISVGVSALEVPDILKIAINSTIDSMQNPPKLSPLHPTSVSPIIIPTPQVSTTPSFIPTEQAAQPTAPTIQPASVQPPTPSSPIGTPEP